LNYIYTSAVSAVIVIIGTTLVFAGVRQTGKNLLNISVEFERQT